ncbi:MAG: 6-bladed beta-propeller [Bacteroidetes bacterium]|nr:6-bladed beta-propeller [Bacteroidota bacterium]
MKNLMQDRFKKKLCFFFLFFVCISLGVAQTTFTIRVSPDNAHGGTASQIFDSIQFTPLETTKESLFGSIDQLEVTDSFFIILDKRGKSILLFYRNGKLHTRITTGGQDKYFNYFTVNRNNRQIIVSNNYANGLLLFDFDGKLLKKQPCPKDVQSLYYFNKNIFLYNLLRPFDQNNSLPISYDLAYSKGYDSVFKYLHPYNSKSEDGQYNIMYSPINFSGQEGTCMFSLPFSYTIFQLNDSGVSCKYQFIFPVEYSLPPNFESDSSYKGKRAKYVYQDQDNYKKVSGITSVYRIDDYLIFSAQRGLMSMDAGWNYLYNLRSGNLYSFTKITGDSTSFYFPLMSNLLEIPNATYKGKIYSSTPAFRLFSIKDNINKQVKYPKVLQDFFINGNKNNNPVIVEFNLKPKL